MPLRRLDRSRLNRGSPSESSSASEDDNSSHESSNVQQSSALLPPPLANNNRRRSPRKVISQPSPTMDSSSPPRVRRKSPRRAISKRSYAPASAEDDDETQPRSRRKPHDSEDDFVPDDNDNTTSSEEVDVDEEDYSALGEQQTTRKRTTTRRGGKIARANGRPRRRRNRRDEEDEFVPDTSSGDESSEEPAWLSDRQEDELSDDSSEDQKNVGNVKDDLGSIGTAEESSNDDEEEKSQQVPASRQKRQQQVLEQSSGDEEMEFRDSGTTTSLPTSPQEIAMRCSSQNDVITEEKLPAVHVCVFLPDGKSRQCFALSTLRRIALTAGHPKFRSDLLRGRDEITFLQPPHFRTAMSADLLDQIASRFGRQALDLHGPYYSKEDAKNNDENDALRSFLDDEPNGNYDEDSFLERIQRYVKNTMGNQDLCVCPLCYTVAHKRCHVTRTFKPANTIGQTKDEEFRKKYTTEYKVDPMEIFASLDHSEFKIASLFCFRTIAQTKEHLRTDHGVNTQGLMGNDLFNRYKV